MTEIPSLWVGLPRSVNSRHFIQLKSAVNPVHQMIVLIPFLVRSIDALGLASPTGSALPQSLPRPEGHQSHWLRCIPRSGS